MDSHPFISPKLTLDTAMLSPRTTKSLISTLSTDYTDKPMPKDAVTKILADTKVKSGFSHDQVPELSFLGTEADGLSLGASQPFIMTPFCPTSFKAEAEVPFSPAQTEEERLQLELQLRGKLVNEQNLKLAALEVNIEQAKAELGRLRERFVNITKDKTNAKNSAGNTAPSKKKEESKAKATSNGTDGKSQPRYWTTAEHNRFLEGLDKFGTKDVKAIALHVGTRSATQVRTHAQKYWLRLSRDAKRSREGKDGKSGKDINEMVDGDHHELENIIPEGTYAIDDPIRDLIADTSLGTVSVLGDNSNHSSAKSKAGSKKRKAASQAPATTSNTIGGATLSHMPQSQRCTITLMEAMLCGDGSLIPPTSTWTREHMSALLNGLKEFGHETDFTKRWSSINQKFLPTKSVAEIEEFYHMFRKHCEEQSAHKKVAAAAAGAIAAGATGAPVGGAASLASLGMDMNAAGTSGVSTTTTTATTTTTTTAAGKKGSTEGPASKKRRIQKSLTVGVKCTPTTGTVTRITDGGLMTPLSPGPMLGPLSPAVGTPLGINSDPLTPTLLSMMTGERTPFFDGQFDYPGTQFPMLLSPSASLPMSNADIFQSTSFSPVPLLTGQTPPITPRGDALGLSGGGHLDIDPTTFDLSNSDIFAWEGAGH
eukprot:GFYU01011036.1.p1 GENE.GFYU01011036.1~~GFYU01011036.1.p1  ORF type:complete len:653 (+),score=131.89 GFYU01011036.1:374-2332(+)